MVSGPEARGVDVHIHQAAGHSANAVGSELSDERNRIARLQSTPEKSNAYAFANVLVMFCRRKFPLMVDDPSVSTINPPDAEARTMLKTKLSATLDCLHPGG